MKKIIITTILTLSTIALHSQSYKRTDLKVNDSTLYVDATNNRVGIGTSSPQDNLHILGTTQMELSGGTKYKFDLRGDGVMNLYNLTSGQNSGLELYSQDGDGTDFVSFTIFGKQDFTGTGTLTNYSRLINLWNTSGYYVVGTDAVGVAKSKLYFNTTGLTNPNLVLDTFGNVGIGMSSPIGKLNINTGATGNNVDVVNQANGSISFANGSGGTAVPNIVGKSTGNVGLLIKAATPNAPASSVDMIFDIIETDNTDYATLNTGGFRFARNNNSLLQILRNGNVGIGTTTPQNKLDVEGGAVIGATYSGTNTAPTNGLLVEGNVGIGTTTDAGYKLDVSGTGRYSGRLSIITSNPSLILAETGSKTTGIRGDLSFDNSALSTVASIRATAVTDNVGTNLDFYTRPASGSLTERMRITSDGKVGIGTNSPSAKMQINSSSYETGLLLNNTDTQYALIGYGALGATKAITGYNAGYALFGGEAGTGTIIQANGQYGFYMDTNLNIYLGSSIVTPTEKLDVDGNARFRSIGSGASAGALHYTSTGVLTTNTSDVRLKTNLQPLQNTLNKLLDINTYTFNWINETDRVDLGMVAQEVEEIFPRLVFTNPVDGYKGIHYDKFSSILTKAIQEQQAIIETQNTKITELETALQALITRVEQLENQ